MPCVPSAARVEEYPRPRAKSGSVLRYSTYVFLAQVLALLCSVVSNFLVARMLGPAGKGLIYVVQTIVGIGLTLLSFGLGPAAIYHLGREQRQKPADVASVLLLPSIVLGLLPAILFAALSPWTLDLFTRKIGPEFLWIAFAAIPAVTVAFNVGYLCLSEGEIGQYNTLRTAPNILFCGFVLAAALIRSGSTIAVAALWILSVCLPALYAVQIARKAGASWIPCTNGLLRSSFHFGWRSHAGSVAQYFQQRIDVVLVCFYLPLRELGIYSLAISIAEMLLYVPQAVAPILMPRVAASEAREANQMTSSLCRTSLALAAVLSCGIALVSTWVIPRILPAFLPSVWVVWLLLPGVIVASVFRILASDFNGRGRPLDTFYPPAIALVACAAAGVYVLPRYGIRGEALVTTAGYLLNAALYVSAYRRFTAERLRDLLLLKRSDLQAAKRLCATALSAITELHEPSVPATPPRLMMLTTSDMGLRLMRGQFRYFREAGYDVTIVSSPGEHQTNAALDEHVRAVALPMAREISFVADSVALFRMYRLMRRIKPDLVSAATPKAGFLGCVAAWLARVPCRVYNQWGLRAETLRGWRRAAAILAEKMACRTAQRVICVSESLRSEIVRLGLAKQERTVVLGSGSCNGVHAECFAPTASELRTADSLRDQLAIPQGAPVIGFVGRLTRDKGVAETITAHNTLREIIPELRLLLLGDFEAGDPLDEATREQIACDPQIVHIGFTEDPGPYYHVFDLLVLPSRREGFANVILEAHAAGKAVVAMRATGTVDAVRDGIDGILVDQDDVQALTNAIAFLLQNNSVRERMGSTGRDRVIAEFAPQRIWHAIAQEYAALLNARGIVPHAPSDGEKRAELPATATQAES
jgi:glycosyltransferase involved in cell wall biosynthesis/O-antigen/teichoic acid export membrane protein